MMLLFYNGVILGAVALDYIPGGQTVFLLGWLLPHGVIEIPAILVGGQAGLVIAHALIGWGDRSSRAERLRHVSRDVVTLAGGVAVMLVWAGTGGGVRFAISRAGGSLRTENRLRPDRGAAADTVPGALGPVAGGTRCALKRF